eukprot:421091_1
MADNSDNKPFTWSTPSTFTWNNSNNDTNNASTQAFSQRNFRFQMCENAETKVDNADENKFEFSWSVVPANKKNRRVKFPKFKRVFTLTEKLNTLQNEIKKQTKKLNELTTEQFSLEYEKKSIEADIKIWYENWQVWNCEDFIQWIFEEIDNGCFKFKRSLHDVNEEFDRNAFIEKLQNIVGRFDKNKGFEGKHLLKLDILDIKELFHFLNGDDCRKLFGEIQKLTKTERLKNENKINQMCEICHANRKQFALACGHIYCQKCVEKLKSCAFCKKTIQKNKMIKIYL